MGKYRLLKSIERAEKAAAWHASIAAAEGVVTAPVAEEAVEEKPVVESATATFTVGPETFTGTIDTDSIQVGKKESKVEKKSKNKK